jgi:hypothetical protein
MRCFALIFVLFFALLASPAAALNIDIGHDTWGLDSFYDVRTYHESHPKAGLMNHRGGWSVSIVFFDPVAADIGKVVYTFDSGTEGAQWSATYNSPMAYWWIDRMNYDYLLFLGNGEMFGSTVTAKVFDVNKKPVKFFMDGIKIGNTLSSSIPKDMPLPPIPVIKKNILLANGKCKLKFMFPFDEYFKEIRIRVFQDPAEGTGAEVQYKFPPNKEDPDPVIREVLKKGVPVEDNLKAIIPAEFQGREGRIEYRTEVNGYMLRGIQYFKLPMPEVE